MIDGRNARVGPPLARPRVAVALIPFLASNPVPMKTLLLTLCACLLAMNPLAADDKKPAANVVTPEEAAKLIAEKKVTVLDIRTPEEFKEGHIAGAVNLDFTGDGFAQKIAALDKSKTYIVHCQGGGRSGRSMPVFDEAKFKNILHLQSGFEGWQAAGKPVEK
jgi:rhodanese-related sulfurtransferase